MDHALKIPFKKNLPQLGDSKDRAAATLQQLEKQFAKSLYQPDANFMEEYLMRKVPANEINKCQCYIAPYQDSELCCNFTDTILRWSCIYSTQADLSIDKSGQSSSVLSRNSVVFEWYGMIW